MYEKMGELGRAAELNDKKDEYIKINMEIADIKKQIKNLQGELKTKEDYAYILMSNMRDICGQTGLTIYAERSEDSGLQ